MMTSYGNCTEGVPWTLEAIRGCVTGDTGTVGTVFGVLCIPLWTSSQLSLYLIYCQPDGKASKTHTGHVTCIVVFHWVADVLSLFGCIMTQQLPLQTYYALTSAIVNFFVIVPAMLSSRRTPSGEEDPGERTSNCACVRQCCMTQSSCTAAMSILSAVSLVTVAMLQLQTSSYQSAIKRHDMPNNDVHFSQSLRVYVLTGYSLGVLSAGLTWLTKFREVIQFYRPYSYTYIRVFLYFVAILSEGFYVTSVLYYNQSRVFILHSLPWTLTRMGVAGIHIGILLQGSVQYFSTREIEADGGYTALIHSATSDSDGSEEDHVMFEFPPMACDGSVDIDDISQTDEGDLGESYAVFPSPNTAMFYSTGGGQEVFGYTYCDSPAETSSEQDLEWDFECPVVKRDDIPLTSSSNYTRMKMGSLKSISSLESDSGYEKVVDWFKRS